MKVISNFTRVMGGEKGFKVRATFNVETSHEEPYVVFRLEKGQPVLECLEVPPGPAGSRTMDFSTKAEAEGFLSKLVDACRELKAAWQSVEIPINREIEI
jgi:hypothetical protein